MDWLFGSSKQSQPNVPDTALRIQTSVAGRPRTIVYGTMRLAPNLIGAWDFTATPQSVGGKGGFLSGGKGGATTYNYSVAVLWALCEGPIDSVPHLWNNQNKATTHVGGNVTLLLGGYAQAPWSYLVSNHPDQADNNRGIAAIGLGPAFLGSSSTLPNVTYEVVSEIRNGIPSAPLDADPRDALVDLFTNVHYGVAFPSGNLDTFDLYSSWCKATGMVASDALVSQQALSDYVKTIMEATDSEMVWSGSLLRIVPYGDVVATGNGATYTPPSYPVATLGDGDFVEITGGGGNSSIPTASLARVQISRPRAVDYDNWVQVEYQDRINDYNTMVVEAKDDAEINTRGYPLNQAGVRRYDFFTTQAAALMSAHLVLGRQLVRNKYSFALDRRWLKLEPMDIVAINDNLTGLVNKLVRIKEIQEQQDGSLAFTCEEYVQGSATPYGYNTEGICCVSNVLSSTVADPGVTSYALWDATYEGVPDGPALVIAAGGAGVPKYPRIGSKGMIALWYYPKYFHDNAGTSGTQTIFKSAPNESGATFLLEGVFSGGGANVTIGTSIHATIAGGGGTVTLTNLADAGPQASIPTTGFGVIVSWDFTTPTWTLHTRINAGTVLAGSHAESDSMDDSHPLFQNQAQSGGVLGTYTVGDATASATMDYAHLWIGLDDEVDLLNMAIPDSVWTKFFCSVTSNRAAPIFLNADGSAPMGCPPTFYFGTAPGTGGVGAGNSTGCLNGAIMPNITGTVSGIGVGTIPACGSYQAVGIQIGASAKLSGFQPFGGMINNWGSCEVWLSTDGGSSYTASGFIPGPSPIGLLTATYASGSDPDTTHTLQVNLTETGQTLASFPTSDADAGRSRSVVDTEIIDFSTATLTSPNNYNMGTYVRRGQLGTTIASHSAGATFGVLGVNSIIIKYPASLIGTTIHFKLVATNKTGGGAQSLADVADNTVTLVGPGTPPPPASVTATNPVSGMVVLVWDLVTAAGVTGYTLKYDSGGPVTTVPIGSSNSYTLTGLAAATYTFDVYSNSGVAISATFATTSLIVT